MSEARAASGASGASRGSGASGGSGGRLLWIAYFFPPLGGGGCQRTLKLVRYLDPRGWASSVVTTRRADYWLLDPTLLEEIPASAEVLRTGGLTPHHFLRLLGAARAGGERGGEREQRRDPGTFRALRRLSSWLLVPDGYRPWANAAARAAARRIAAGGIDAVWTTSSPESAHLAGLALRRRFGLPWVADFRDPWVGRVTYAPPSRWHDERHRALERDVVLAADRVTVVSEAMASLYRERYPQLPRERVAVLENGFDPDDWRRAGAGAFASTVADAAQDRGRFVLLHAGQLAHRPTARTLLEGARRAIAAEPGLGGTLRIRFLGGNEELVPGDPLLSALGPVVSLAPSRPHLESMAAMKRADALALLGHGGPADSLLYTGKIYEYATSGRRVLGVVDSGPAADLIRDARIGAVVASSDADGVAAVLRDWIAQWRRHGPTSVSPPESLEQTWERSRRAAEAARILAEIGA